MYPVDMYSIQITQVRKCGVAHCTSGVKQLNYLNQGGIESEEPLC